MLNLLAGAIMMGGSSSTSRQEVGKQNPTRRALLRITLLLACVDICMHLTQLVAKNSSSSSFVEEASNARSYGNRYQCGNSFGVTSLVGRNPFLEPIGRSRSSCNGSETSSTVDSRQYSLQDQQCVGGDGAHSSSSSNSALVVSPAGPPSTLLANAQQLQQMPEGLAQQDPGQGGNWLLGSFVEHMHCEMAEEQDVEFWRDVHRLTTALDPLNSDSFDAREYEQVRHSAGLPDISSPAAQAAPGEHLFQRLMHVRGLLEHVLVPYKVVDPVFALECPLGTASLLRQFARYCLHLFQENCRERAVRVLQLAKLMTLFNFPDYGTMMQQSKWRADLGMLSGQVYELYGPDAQLASAADIATRRRVAEGSDLQAPSKLSIGIVSYCNYGNSSFPLPGWSRRNKESYAKRHGYALYHLEKPIVKQYHPWMNKLLAVRHFLGSHDWIMWADCDAYFMTPEERVEMLLVDSATGTVGEAMDFVIAEDGNMFNSGIFLLRNSNWGRKFLNNSIDLLAAPMPYSFQHNQWHEQSPFMYLALVPSILDINTLMDADDTAAQKRQEEQKKAAQEEVSATAYDHVTADSLLQQAEARRHTASMKADEHRKLGYDPQHIRVIPQSLMNSYPPELVERTAHALRHHAWRPGDFVISFNGCGSVLGGDICLRIFGSYFEQSMQGVQE
ncbi:unnamed protein product [Amoebophrya sp. A25]|nr:unnamed protein product [Amoebophrya sp. A25]|eukprot:GSA25T00013597001.1